LRVLDTGECKRVGGNTVYRVDVRIIAATNKDLEREVREGRFREDLFFRLDVVTLRLPPLRERGDDIEILIQHFIQKFAARQNKPMRGISSLAMKMLKSYKWPGNVRELENAVERAVSLSFEGIITPKELPKNITKDFKEMSDGQDVLIPFVPEKKMTSPAAERVRGESEGEVEIEEGDRKIGYFNIVNDRPTLDIFTSRYLRLLLKEHKNNKSKVAQILGVERMTLYNMLERYGIDRKDNSGNNSRD
ncbi:MAG: sigma 54-interacting transcriptional regulator, partial [Deltaproteobacteria bacterium]|nr:sigma 54-interacting transcriptional regulator [Deltaproteobacteria bacterium]